MMLCLLTGIIQSVLSIYTRRLVIKASGYQELQVPVWLQVDALPTKESCQEHRLNKHIQVPKVTSVQLAKRLRHLEADKHILLEGRKYFHSNVCFVTGRL